MKGHAGGRQATGQDPDFFFDRGGQFGPNLGCRSSKRRQPLESTASGLMPKRLASVVMITALLATLAECYQQLGVAADQLPYTEGFERLYEEVQRLTGMVLTRAEFWRMLANARKRGALPRLTR